MNPDLADLDAFAAVARTRSFRGAATVRGVSASALSEAVRRLEARLGLRLLNRTTRSVTPTEAGTQLLERLAPALSEVSAAIDAVNKFRNSPTGTLRLNVPGIVAQLFLPPIVERFLRAHPGIVIEVTADDSFIDVVAAGFDAGVRYDERLEQDMIAVPIGPRVSASLSRRHRPILRRTAAQAPLRPACARASATVPSGRCHPGSSGAGKIVRHSIRSADREHAGAEAERSDRGARHRTSFEEHPRRRSRAELEPVLRLVAELLRPIPLLCRAATASAARLIDFVKRNRRIGQGLLENFPR
jgi:DNA-binding transcriptional LysR family regulator